MRDVYDHTGQVIDTLETLRETVAEMLDVYVPRMTNRPPINALRSARVFPHVAKTFPFSNACQFKTDAGSRDTKRTVQIEDNMEMESEGRSFM